MNQLGTVTNFLFSLVPSKLFCWHAVRGLVKNQRRAVTASYCMLLSIKTRPRFLVYRARVKFDQRVSLFAHFSILWHAPLNGSLVYWDATGGKIGLPVHYHGPELGYQANHSITHPMPPLQSLIRRVTTTGCI